MLEMVGLLVWIPFVTYGVVQVAVVIIATLMEGAMEKSFK